MLSLTEKFSFLNFMGQEDSNIKKNIQQMCLMSDMEMETISHRLKVI